MGSSLTGSGMDRALHCAPSFALPGVREDSGHAFRGRVVHGFLELLSTGTPRSEALATVPDEYRLICESINPGRVPNGEAELAYAYNVRTGVARRQEVEGRRYEATHEEVSGRIDLVCERENGGFEVIDWKTTRWTFDAVAAKPQLNFYALCVARERGLDEIGVAIAVITDDGALAFNRWTLDVDDLARVASDTRRAWEAVQGAKTARMQHEASAIAPWTPDVSLGAWCRYCPAQSACPGVRAQIGALLGEDLDEVTPENAARAFQAAQVAEAAAKRARAAVGLVHDTEGPVPCGDGRVIKRDRRGALKVFGGRAA